MSQGIIQHMCFDKRRYPTMELASESIDFMKIKSPEAAMISLRVYECPSCGGYHITKRKSKDDVIQKSRWLSGESL
jgi:hypothetical protein